MVYDYLLKHIKELSLDNFCKFYLLLAISKFLLPNGNGRVFSILFNNDDDLGSIQKYNWGGVVYEYLVGTIYATKMFLRDKPNSKHFHVCLIHLVFHLMTLKYVVMIFN